ncbi:SIMPL domain-containing protein [Alteromonas halophila]|uniref:SIMPL domain-containing protein n=1 Tax=Alteromonas halophila TaxID=516698 RepID=A0A918JQQ5_9ALTE|nr:SIMPL domain-containing protein [Alteromonas halophila]GGW93936.1 SIMPL domain-containing protein [Alteromonas halophila]
MNKAVAVILALGISAGLLGLGAQLGQALITFKTWDRVVTVKGLSEREYTADRVIWPIAFIEAGNDLPKLYDRVADNAGKVKDFLTQAGIAADTITIGRPEITDKAAQQYGGGPRAEFRYSATQTVTVYSENVEKVTGVMNDIASLVRDGVVLTDQRYQSRPEFVFTRLNEVKPEMIEEATVNAREVAEKFASDSNSTLGKIKRANQGQFSISSRDAHHPHIKRVRVVSTIDYTLVD